MERVCRPLAALTFGLCYPAFSDSVTGAVFELTPGFKAVAIGKGAGAILPHRPELKSITDEFRSCRMGTWFDEETYILTDERYDIHPGMQICFQANCENVECPTGTVGGLWERPDGEAYWDVVQPSD